MAVYGREYAFVAESAFNRSLHRNLHRNCASRYLQEKRDLESLKKKFFSFKVILDEEENAFIPLFGFRPLDLFICGRF